jgi:multicomponent Na+:H+ antiporter subunit D
LNPSLIPAGLVLSPLIGALSIAVVALRSPRLAQALTVLSSLVGLVLAAAALWHCRDGAVINYAYGGWPAPYGIAARIDGIGAVLAALIAAVALGTFVYAGPTLRFESPGFEPAFYAMALLLVAALQGMTATADLFNLYVFLEISSLAAYALIAVGGGAASLASFRYLVIGTVGASLYLLGVAYLFALTGSLNSADIALALADVAPSGALLLALALLTVGLGLKMALFPMHGWLPDAYTYAPSAATALIGGLMTKVGALALLRVLYGVFQPAHAALLPGVTTIISALGCAGIVVGSVLAVAQRDLKRLLAYSSIAHLGFIGVGIGLGNRAGVTAAVFHMVAHGVAKATLFLIAGGIAYRLGTRSTESLAGLHHSMPWSTAALVIAALSMIGIPPTAGFYSKWYLLMGCLDAGRPDLFAVVVASTLLSAWYFLRLFETIFFLPPAENRRRAELPMPMLGAIGVGAVALIALGLVNQEAINGLIGATSLVAGQGGAGR